MAVVVGVYAVPFFGGANERCEADERCQLRKSKNECWTLSEVCLSGAPRRKVLSEYLIDTCVLASLSCGVLG